MYRFGRKLAGKMNDMYWATLRKIKGRQAIDRRNRKRIRNTDVSIIASNCNGGIISHDLGLQFRSPFVNLWIEPGDFVKLLSNLEEYLQCDLVFITAGDIPYPVSRSISSTIKQKKKRSLTGKKDAAGSIITILR